MECNLDPLRLVHDDNRPNATLRLFCFPYAGGGSLVFKGWSSYLPLDIDVCTIELSGRARFSMRGLDGAPAEMFLRMERALRWHLERPYALFGHSAGALMVFLLARRLQADGLALPRALFVAAHRAPQLPRRRAALHELPDDALIRALGELAGTPAEVLDNREMLELYLPALRADLRFSEGYRHEAGPVLRCPIFAFGGVEDREVSETELAAWGAQTSGEFKLTMLSGNHFFLHDKTERLVTEIAQSLERVGFRSEN
jgi:medium-chain acyl-[acyl-carrier-protein] hydrolase